ncbi:MAG: hypothetical protein WB761_14780 [Solirubrobacteraceae bacterium]
MPVDDERRRGNRTQGPALRRLVVVIDEAVVRCRGRVISALDVALHEIEDVRLVERALSAPQHAPVVDEIVAHRGFIGPVDLGSGQESSERRVTPGQVALAGHRRRGAHEHQREHTVGAVEHE